MDGFNSRRDCYCAFCGHKRKVYHLKKSALSHLLLSLLISILLMWAIWLTIEPKAIYIFIVVHCLTEFIVHFRWRVSLVCSQCGFDPLIYIRDKNKAAQKVKAYLLARKTDPKFLLAPKLHLPFQPTDKSRAAHAMAEIKKKTSSPSGSKKVDNQYKAKTIVTSATGS